MKETGGTGDEKRRLACAHGNEKELLKSAVRV